MADAKQLGIYAGSGVEALKASDKEEKARRKVDRAAEAAQVEADRQEVIRRTTEKVPLVSGSFKAAFGLVGKDRAVSGGSKAWVTPPQILAKIREYTATPNLQRPKMPCLRQDNADGVAEDLTPDQVAHVARLAWLAVCNKFTTASISHMKKWTPRYSATIANAISVWRHMAPSIAPVAVAVDRWNTVLEWSGKDPRAAILVFTKVNKFSLRRAAAIHDTCNATTIQPPPSVKALLQMRRQAEHRLRRANPSSLTEAWGMLDAMRLRESAAPLRKDAEADVRKIVKDLYQRMQKGAWIW